MTLKYVVIGIMTAALLVLVPNVPFVNASLNEPREPLTEEEMESGFYNEEGYLLGKNNRPAINLDLDPDESCLFDVYQEQCIPGSEQECPRPQFGNNEDSTCFPNTLIDGEWQWECPEGYHSAEYDETGQCYPNSE